VRLRRAVPAGLLDAGCASLATFAVGLQAARALPADVLGAYALFFSAFLLAAVVPTQLLLIPAEIAALAAPRAHRAQLLRQSWRLGGPASAGAAVVATASAALAAAAERDVVVALAVSAAACAWLSPLQDHVRRTLHLAGASWRAAIVSAAQLLGVVVALLALAASGVAPVWQPFGALALANAASLAVGFGLGRAGGDELPRLSLPPLLRSGRWLLLAELAPTGAGFGSSVVITHLAGAAALGHAEAARIVAQPVFVLAVGLSAVLGPRSMEAAAAGSRRAADRIALPFWGVLAAAGGAYGLAASQSWPHSPLVALVPQAYVLGGGLVALWVVAHLLLGAAFPLRSELLGAGRESAAARGAVAAAAVQLATSLSAPWTGAAARPLTYVANGGALVVDYGRRRRGLDRSPREEPAEAAP